MSTFIPKLKKSLSSVPVIGPIARKIYRGFTGDPRAKLLSALPKGSRCAELGVWRGAFSQQILAEVKPKSLVLVDPWAFVPTFEDRWYGGLFAKSQSDMDAIHDAVAERFAANSEVEIVRMKSDDFLSTTEMEFDWIYIDGDHSEEPVYRDLCLSWERVVPGGAVCGDDYHWLDSDGKLPVKAAVDRFVSEKNCKVRFFGAQFLIDRD
ncbi:MAG: class I SAM-dependent methyltransferase [Pseudomonadota bacterium]